MAPAHRRSNRKFTAKLYLWRFGIRTNLACGIQLALALKVVYCEAVSFGVELMHAIALLFNIRYPCPASPRLKSTHPGLDRLQELEARQQEWKQASGHSAP